MKKSIILKSFLVILVCTMLVFTASSVYAASDEGYNDLLTDLEGNTTGNSTSNTGNTNTNTNTNRNTNSNSSNVQNINALRNNTSNRTNIANNTNLPKTGIQDSLPTVLLVVVFGISAVYAYKKVKDYRNID